MNRRTENVCVLKASGRKPKCFAIIGMAFALHSKFPKMFCFDIHDLMSTRCFYYYLIVQHRETKIKF